jgi:hypothetical protein
MKKNQDKRKSAEKTVSHRPGEAVEKSVRADKNSDRSQITLVPLNLRSKF